MPEAQTMRQEIRHLKDKIKRQKGEENDETLLSADKLQLEKQIEAARRRWNSLERSHNHLAVNDLTFGTQLFDEEYRVKASSGLGQEVGAGVVSDHDWAVLQDASSAWDSANAQLSESFNEAMDVLFQLREKEINGYKMEYAQYKNLLESQKQLGISKDNQIDQLIIHRATLDALTVFDSQGIASIPNSKGLHALDVDDDVTKSDWNVAVCESLIIPFFAGDEASGFASIGIDDMFLRLLRMDGLGCIRQNMLILFKSATEPDYMGKLSQSARKPTHRSNQTMRPCLFDDPVTSRAPDKVWFHAAIHSACFHLSDDVSVSRPPAAHAPSVPRPSRHYARVHIISANCESLFVPHDEIIVEVSGAGLSYVYLSLEALPSARIKGEEFCTFHLNQVDTLCADVDRTKSSWSFRRLTHRIRLSFPSPERLDGFLFTLMRIRVSQAYLPVERHLSEVDLKEFYVIRAAAYTHARIHVLPAELLSEIFLFFRPSSAQYRPWESPLLLLQICSAWRSAAIGTPRLWHNPSFTLDPSFLHTDDRNPSFTYDHHDAHLQMLYWLTRARSVPISLSSTFQDSVHPSGKRFDSTQSSPSSFDSVKMLALYCTQPQFQLFLGVDAPLLPTLETLSITVPKATFDGHRLINLSHLLRSLAIETERFENASRRCDYVLLSVSTWIPIFFQCLSLQSGSFILRRARRSDPVTPTVFRDIASLRISFSGPSDTGFFDHVVFPVLRELHLTAGELDLEPMPILPTLRVLILDAVVPGLALQRIILAHPQLEELSVLTLDGTMCPDIWGLRYLRILTICASISDPDLVQTFVQDTAARVVQAVSAGCSLRIFAEEATLDSVRIALTDEHRVKVSIHCDPSLIPSPKPVDRLLSPRLFFFLTVERLLAL
ncbi:hypothetical protein DFH06DRAFT_1327622 [Mycena polygramma]|nr:hypothetical protein DFH06DRAFT_1327622 [Mycena polygramma]